MTAPEPYDHWLDIMIDVFDNSITLDHAELAEEVRTAITNAGYQIGRQPHYQTLPESPFQ